jgi:hypothetical protein
MADTRKWNHLRPRPLCTSGLALRNLDSSDLNGSARVVVTAFVKAHQRVDDEAERIVGWLSLEPRCRRYDGRR